MLTLNRVNRQIGQIRQQKLVDCELSNRRMISNGGLEWRISNGGSPNRRSLIETSTKHIGDLTCKKPIWLFTDSNRSSGPPVFSSFSPVHSRETRRVIDSLVQTRTSSIYCIGLRQLNSFWRRFRSGHEPSNGSHWLWSRFMTHKRYSHRVSHRSS